MKNNKGLSYVELLVVIAVMVLITGISVISVGIVSRTNATKMGDKLVTMLRTSRTVSLAKGSEEGALNIRKSGNKYECAIGDISDNPEFTTIGSSPLVLYHYNTEDGLMPIVESIGVVTIKFDQSNGSILSCNVGGDLIDALEIWKDEDASVRIELYEVTGKCEMILK